MSKHNLKDYWKLAKDAFNVFKENHPVKFASAIAYFSLFALPCIFLIIVTVLNLLFSKNEVYRVLEEKLKDVVGDDGASILVEITENYSEQASESTLYLLMYVIVVFWLSTQLFRLFQNSLNDLWSVKPDFKSFWQRIWVERGLTFILVLGTGLLFFASLGFEKGLEAVFGESGIGEGTSSIIVNALTVLLVFFWFALLYKLLPAVKIKWQPTLVGAAITTVFFFAGFWLLWNFVILRDLEEIYAVVAPIIRVALWVFYSSLVFLYGASLTRTVAQLENKEIAPASYATRYSIVRDEEINSYS